MLMENNEIESEYDFSQMKSLGKGRYSEKYKESKNIVHLDPDITDYFKDDKAVNDALRLLISIANQKIK